MIDFEEKIFPQDGSALWAGMGNYRLVSANRIHQIQLTYIGEPPHGDSYHQIVIDEHSFPGHVWGCMFALSHDYRYLVFSWMPALAERKAVVVDIIDRRYFVLPEYFYDFSFNWPYVLERGVSTGRVYEFTGKEQWCCY